jgi:hypothetical protein
MLGGRARGPTGCVADVTFAVRQRPNIVRKRSYLLCVRGHISCVSEVEFSVSQRSSLLYGRGCVA